MHFYLVLYQFPIMAILRRLLEQFRTAKEALVERVRNAEGLEVRVVPYKYLTDQAQDHVDTIKWVRPAKAVFGPLSLIALPLFFTPGPADWNAPVGSFFATATAQESYVRRMGKLATLFKENQGQALVEPEHHAALCLMQARLEPTHFSVDREGNLVFMRARGVSRFKAFMTQLPLKTRRQPIL